MLKSFFSKIINFFSIFFGFRRVEQKTVTITRTTEIRRNRRTRRMYRGAYTIVIEAIEMHGHSNTQKLWDAVRDSGHVRSRTHLKQVRHMAAA